MFTEQLSSFFEHLVLPLRITGLPRSPSGISRAAAAFGGLLRKGVYLVECLHLLGIYWRMMETNLKCGGLADCAETLFFLSQR